MRTLLSVAAVGIILLASCEGREGEKGGANAALVSETDSLFCGQSATLYTNHTGFAKDLHVRVHNGCMTMMPETVLAVPARIEVLDGRNQVVNGQSVLIPEGQTHRGTFSVPGGASLKLSCANSEIKRGGCQWHYEYAL